MGNLAASYRQTRILAVNCAHVVLRKTVATPGFQRGQPAALYTRINRLPPFRRNQPLFKTRHSAGLERKKAPVTCVNGG